MAQPTGQVHDWTPAYCDFEFDLFHILKLCTCVAWLLEAVLPAWDKVTSWPERPWKTGAWDSETEELSIFEVAPPVILLGSLEAGKFKQGLGVFISSQFPPTPTFAAWFASLRGWMRHLQASWSRCKSSCCLNILFAEVGRPLPTSPPLPQHKWRGSSFDICQQDMQQNVWRQQRFITWGQTSLFLADREIRELHIKEMSTSLYTQMIGSYLSNLEISKILYWCICFLSLPWYLCFEPPIPFAWKDCCGGQSLQFSPPTHSH